MGHAMNAIDPRIEAAAQQLEKQGFLGWLLSNGDSLLWTRISPEWEMARVTLAAADAVDPLRQPGIVTVDTNDAATLDRVVAVLYASGIQALRGEYGRTVAAPRLARAVLAELAGQGEQ